MPCPIRFGPEPRMMTLGLCGRRRLVLFVVSGVEVRRHGFELGRAGIHEFEDRLDALALTQFPHLLGAGMAFQFPLGGDAFVAQSEAFQMTQVLRTYIFWSSLLRQPSVPR